MSVSAVEIRPAQPTDLPPLAAFIARANAKPAGRCLHCTPTSEVGVRANLRDFEEFPGGWERGFVVGTENSNPAVTAALGCQYSPDETLGYLWGPWMNTAPEAGSQVAPALLAALLKQLPPSVRRLDAFLHVENRAGLRFLQAHGFTPGPVTHVYVAPRSSWVGGPDAGPFHAPLLPRHEVGFAALHADTFPAHGSTAAEDLLSGRDDSHVIFAATDGLRLLGSVCVSVNRAPREGFIDYLAVKPSARGRGIGASLLRTALRWAFEERHLPQVALTVSDWRDGARRLYEQAGFALRASGVATRRKLDR